MAINFSQGTEITTMTNGINIPGSIVRVINSQSTVSTTIGTGSWVNTMSAAITITKPGNKILVEYLMNHRNDSGNGTWGLTFNRVLVNGAEAMNGGHAGSASNHIGFYERTFLYTPPSTGTYTFTGQARAYQNTSWIGSYNSGSTNHYLRLYEIGS
jgi:hypothetical protein